MPSTRAPSNDFPVGVRTGLDASSNRWAGGHEEQLKSTLGSGQGMQGTEATGVAKNRENITENEQSLERRQQRRRKESHVETLNLHLLSRPGGFGKVLRILPVWERGLSSAESSDLSPAPAGHRPQPCRTHLGTGPWSALFAPATAPSPAPAERPNRV